MLACGGAEDHPPLAPADGNQNGNNSALMSDVATGSCQAEQERECKVVLPPQGGITNCVVGTQHCLDGQWGACEEKQE